MLDLNILNADWIDCETRVGELAREYVSEGKNWLAMMMAQYSNHPSWSIFPSRRNAHAKS